MVDCRSEMTEGKFLGVNKTKSCVSSAYSRWEMVEELIRVLSGVVYRLNRIGPRTEPWVIPHVREGEGERCSGMETADVRDNKYEVNHWRERPTNQPLFNPSSFSTTFTPPLLHSFILSFLPPDSKSTITLSIIWFILWSRCCSYHRTKENFESSTILSIVNLSITTSTFHSTLQSSIFGPLLKNLNSIRKMCQITALLQTFPSSPN